VIPIEKLTELEHIVVHDACPDGSASAMILRLCFPEADVQFVQYDSPQHEALKIQGSTIFADFSPHDSQIKDFVAAEAVVLDHHKTQKGAVAEFGELGVFGDEVDEPGVCGAVLAYREVFQPLVHHYGGSPVILTDDFRQRFLPDFAKLAGIRDTWQTQDPRWREACEQAAALHFWPDDTLLATDPQLWQEKLSLGPILFQRKLDMASRNADNSFRFTSEAGTKVAVFEGSTTTSDAAEYLDKEVDLVIGFDIFMQGDKPAMIFSTRSHTDFDCALMAKSHGGGGHTKAAGFKWELSLDDPNPFMLAVRVVNAFELAADGCQGNRHEIWAKLRKRWPERTIWDRLMEDDPPEG